MQTSSKAYYHYEDEQVSFYDDDENYDDYTSYDDILDHIIDNLERHGCKYQIDEIEEFLTDHSRLTLSEWSRDLMDPSLSEFTINYITQLLTQKYETPMKITPPTNNKLTETPTSQHENEKQKVQADKKWTNVNNTIQKVFTDELQTKFKKAAFHQWKSTIIIPQPRATLSPFAKEFKPTTQSKNVESIFSTTRTNNKAKVRELNGFSRESKMAFTKAAFHYWKITTQAAMIPAKKLKPAQEVTTAKATTTRSKISEAELATKTAENLISENKVSTPVTSTLVQINTIKISTKK
jgi:hypothetical protein